MGFCFGIKGLRGCWLTLHTRRPEQCRERTRDRAPADRLHRFFSPVYFFYSSSFFFPRAWVPVCVSLSFVIFCLARGPRRLNCHFKRQTWMHSRSPSLKQFYFYPHIYLVLLFHSLGVRGERTRWCDHPDVHGEDKCLQLVSSTASSAAASVPHGDRSPCVQHPSVLTNLLRK